MENYVLAEMFNLSMDTVNVCNVYGHKPTKCRSNMTFRRSGNGRMNDNKSQQSLVCYNCNEKGHIAKHCEKRNEKIVDPEKKIDINEEKEKMKIPWINKYEVKVEEMTEDGFAPAMDVDPSFEN